MISSSREPFLTATFTSFVLNVQAIFCSANRRRFWVPLVFVGALVLNASGAVGQDNAAPSSLEYQIKSSLVFNFLKFIEWPEGGLSDRFILCHFDNDKQYRRPLSELSKREVLGKQLLVQAVKDENFDNCNVVIASQNIIAATQLQAILNSGRAVLTIGETEDFLGLGGIIRFVVVNNTVRFEISQTHAEQVGLSISSKLLRLAQHVER